MRLLWYTLALALATRSEFAPRSNEAVKIHLSSRKWQNQEDGHVKMHLCKGCDPRAGGSVIVGFRSYFEQDSYDVSGDVILMVPNHGERKPFNKEDIHDSIAMVERGKNVPIATKVLRAQQAGALGVLVIDHGECDVAMVNCGWAGKVEDGGFGRRDQYVNWRDIHIPVILLHQLEGDRIKGLMEMSKIELSGYGLQNVTILAD